MFTILGAQERESWKRGWPGKLKYACAGAEQQVKGKKGNYIIETRVSKR